MWGSPFEPDTSNNKKNEIKKNRDGIKVENQLNEQKNNKFNYLSSKKKKEIVNNLKKVTKLVERVKKVSDRVDNIKEKVQQRPNRIIKKFKKLIRNCEIDMKKIMLEKTSQNDNEADEQLSSSQGDIIFN